MVHATPRVRWVDHSASLIPDQLQQFSRLRQPGTGGIAERRVAVLQAATQRRDIRSYGGFEHAQILLPGKAMMQVTQGGLSLAEGDGLRLIGQPHSLDSDRTDRFDCVPQNGAVRGKKREVRGHRRACLNWVSVLTNAPASGATWGVCSAPAVRRGKGAAWR